MKIVRWADGAFHGVVVGRVGWLAVGVYVGRGACYAGFRLGTRPVVRVGWGLI